MPKEIYGVMEKIKYDKWIPKVQKKYLLDAKELGKHWDCPASHALYQAEDKGREEGMAKGKAEGRAEGKEEEKRGIARTMLENGIGLAIVCKCTGLSIDEIRTLTGKNFFGECTPGA
ncbi:MAG: hypothetical protein LBR91_02155 [Puniceicoccales bacterium]|jgi:predicted transposase/invertase (TIGR01784 family)|nr:hypothetical protein [Puniceicoccales bacterium]